MTPKPPPPSDGSSLPPRHRPPVNKLAKDTTEGDLWAFDELDPLEEIPQEQPEKELKPALPEPRETKSGSERQAVIRNHGAASSSNSGEKNFVKLNRKATKARPAKAKRESAASGPGRDFDDLDSWDDVIPAPIAEEPAEDLKAPAIQESTEEVKTPQPVVAETAAAEEVLDDREEFSPKVRQQVGPIAIRSNLNLTKVERMGLISLAVLILIGSVVFYLNTINRLPTGSARSEQKDFPIKGSLLTVESAATYWRAPITTGDNVDTVRRDTLLIPVVDLTTSGGATAIRVFFKDSDGELIGDPVTRSIQGHMELKISATAGFDDLGKHAAYRMNQTKPWSIEVLEAVSASASADKFKKVFEINISADRR